MSLSPWGASGSSLFLASALILAAATLSKAQEADSVGPRMKAPRGQGLGVCNRKLLFQGEVSSVGIFLLSPQVWIWACALKPQLHCIISETSVLGELGRPGGGFGPISHSGVRSPIVASWRGVGEMPGGGCSCSHALFYLGAVEGGSWNGDQKGPHGRRG